MSDDEPLTGHGMFAVDPHAFCSYFWPDMMLYPQQLEIAESVVHNKKTFVHTGNQLGKTRIAAIIALWFFATRTPAIVVTSSSSEKQLKGILWQEIASLVQQSAHAFDSIRLLTLEAKWINPADGKETPKHYMVGHVTRQVENFQGHHLDEDMIPRVLFVFDESSGVDDEFYDATDSQAHRTLVIGNPLNTTNFFYRECRSGDQAYDDPNRNGLLKKVIHINATDSPNVIAAKRFYERGGKGMAPPKPIPGILSYREYQERKTSWDKFKIRVRLDGKFPEGADDQLFPIDVLDLAQNNWKKLPLDRSTLRKALGIDCAGVGRDKSAWCVVDELGVVEEFARDTPDTMEILGTAIRLMKKWNIQPGDVSIDSGGMGKPLGDRMWEQDYEIRLINFGESANDKKSYFNKRAEMYGRVSLAMASYLATFDSDDILTDGFVLPPVCNKLREELSVLPDSRDSEGRLKLPSKERRTGSSVRSIRDILGRSPDQADALVLAWESLGKVIRPPRPKTTGITATSIRPKDPKPTEEDAPPKRQSALSRRLDATLGPEKPKRR